MSGEVQTDKSNSQSKEESNGDDKSNGELNHSQSKEDSNGDVPHENGTDQSKNGNAHETNGQIGPKPVIVAKSGHFSKLMMFLMLGSFFLATSVYVVVEYKDGPVAAVIESAISKEYADVLIHHINHDLAPFVDSLKGSIREGIQKITGQDLAGKVEDVEKSKDIEVESSNNVDKEKVETETKQQSEESKSSEFEKNTNKEETIEVKRNAPIHQEDGKKKETRKDPKIKVAEEKLKVEKVENKFQTKEELKLNARKETNEKDSMEIKENENILEAEKEAESRVAKNEIKLVKDEDKTSKEETEDITSKVTNDESKLKDAISSQAMDDLKIKEADEIKASEENLGTEKELKNMNDVKEEVLKATKKYVENPYPPKEELKV